MDRWHLDKCYDNLFCFVFFIVYGRYFMQLNHTRLNSQNMC